LLAGLLGMVIMPQTPAAQAEYDRKHHIPVIQMLLTVLPVLLCPLHPPPAA
jgi:hypothetical protein